MRNRGRNIRRMNFRERQREFARMQFDRLCQHNPPLINPLRDDRGTMVILMGFAPIFR